MMPIEVKIIIKRKRVWITTLWNFGCFSTLRRCSDQRIWSMYQNEFDTRKIWMNASWHIRFFDGRLCCWEMCSHLNHVALYRDSILVSTQGTSRYFIPLCFALLTKKNLKLGVVQFFSASAFCFWYSCAHLVMFLSSFFLVSCEFLIWNPF